MLCLTEIRIFPMTVWKDYKYPGDLIQITDSTNQQSSIYRYKHIKQTANQNEWHRSSTAELHYSAKASVPPRDK